ncbi:transglycosylase family protein [Promicromonospora sp. NPDC052451]|uniref:transglycosylase family protein n=1 Tax=Promicromonospora sp. NPDC052451 TaxID=3364407 RepID=UPI0037C7C8F9
MVSPQGSPSDSRIDPDADGDLELAEIFRPPPRSYEVFPAAMFTVPDTVAGAETGVSEVMAGMPPGHPSGPVPVVPAGDGPPGSLGVLPVPPPPPPPPEPPRRKRKAAMVTAAAVVLAGAGGAVAYGEAHKTVTLDVDGDVTTVETFQGDVADLLTDEGVEVSRRDEVAPGIGAALSDGSTVVVRTAHRLTLRADGERRTAWVAALDADQALDTLSAREGDVVLLPAVAGGSATLPMRLHVDGPVTLVAGGKEQQVADGAVMLDALLAAHDVRVDGDDRIVVERRPAEGSEEPALTVVVQQVQTSIEETVSEIPFETVTATDPGHYEDLGPYLARSGAVGERVTSWDITRVDGKVTSREKLSTWVSRPPVDKVIMYGTKARPAPEPEKKDKDKGKEAGKDASKDSSKDSGKDSPKGEDGPKGKDSPKGDDEPKEEDRPEPDATAPVDEPAQETRAQTLSAPVGDVWTSLAACESGGDPTTNTGNGYYGLYQFSQGTWEAMGGSGLPSDASAAEQTMRAQALQRQSGWGQWPACSAALGLS